MMLRLVCSLLSVGQI